MRKHCRFRAEPLEMCPGIESVEDPRLGSYVMVGIIRFDLAAQPEQHPQELGLPHRVTTGSGHQPRARGHHLFGMCGEKNQQVELFLCQLHLVTPNGNSSRLEIDAKIPRLDDLGRWCRGFGPRLKPTPNAAKDLLKADWACHLINLGSELPCRWGNRACDRKPQRKSLATSRASSAGDRSFTTAKAPPVIRTAPAAISKINVSIYPPSGAVIQPCGRAAWSCRRVHAATIMIG